MTRRIYVLTIAIISILIALVIHLSNNPLSDTPPESKVRQDVPTNIRDSLFVIYKDSVPHFYYLEDYR